MDSSYDTGRFAEVSGLDEVTTQSDVVDVVEQMLADLRSQPTAWENSSLERFLDAFAACLDATPGGAGGHGGHAPVQPTWRLLAEMLVKASGYE
jgi:hypothetical protein